MKVGVYFCACGNSVSEKVSHQVVAENLAKVPGVAYVRVVEFLCSEEGKQFLEQDLIEHRPDRVVVAACSPREIESAFMQVLEKAGMNPYLLQVANIREQVAWITEDPEQAARKACAAIRAAVARVGRHEPLERKKLPACRDVLVVGAGPAGLKAALSLAEAGRRVTMVEKSPVIGGMPVRYEELFPNMECGPCLLEPVEGEVLHGEYAHNIEILTLAELVDVKGYYGNFTVTVKKSARHLDETKCVGCGACIPACPATLPNEFNYGLDVRTAMALPFAGALPNVPFLTESACLRWQGQDCQLCRDACPVPDTVLYEDSEKLLEREVGAIVLAIGGGLYDCHALPGLGYGQIPGIYTSLEFERILARNGPTGGEIRLTNGDPPARVAIVHCVGSLDERRRPYCSGICCSYAFKFNHLVRKKLPEAAIYHLYRELVAPGKEQFALHQHLRHDPHSQLLRYRDIEEVRIAVGDRGMAIQYQNAAGAAQEITADILVLCPAMGGAASAPGLAAMVDAPVDRFGFFQELHGRVDAPQSKVKGVYLAGTCQAPMDIRGATEQGMAVAGYVLSGLADGKELRIEPTTATVDEDTCSGCRICGTVCPYKAISFVPEREVSSVNALLCHGCGTCSVACPSGAILAHHFSNSQILAEMEAVLQ